MNEVIASAAPPKINFTELNVRQTQGKPHFVRLNDNVVKRLERQLIDSPPVTGSERFGLLLGSIEAGNPCTIAIEDFEPTPKLEERINVWKPGPKGPQRIIGYYRSHREADFAFTPADRGLFERCFPKGSRLALLVRPAGDDVGTAMFFLGDDGQLAPDRATVEFPFNLRELGAEDSPGVASAPAPSPKPVAVAPSPKPVAVAMKPAVLVAQPIPTHQAIPVPVVTVPTPAAAAPRRGGVIAKLAIAGAVVIVSVFGLTELHVFNGGVSQPQAQSKATVGATVIESKPAAEPAAAPAEPKLTVKELPATPKPQTAKPVVATTATTKPAAHLKKSANDSTAPVAAPAQPALVAQNIQIIPTVVPQVPPPAASTQTRPVNPQPTPVAPPAATPASPAPSPKPAEVSVPITPPHAIRQFAPVLPDKVRKNISGEMVVRVRATVNAAGKVTSAETVADGSAIPDELALNAVNAVKQSQFEPARRGGEKVAGDVVLSFTFRK